MSKVYLLFKCKDMSKEKKEYIVDRIYTTYHGAMVREARLHGEREPVRFFINGVEDTPPVVKSPVQETYIINKSLKGKFK